MLDTAGELFEKGKQVKQQNETKNDRHVNPRERRLLEAQAKISSLMSNTEQRQKL